MFRRDCREAVAGLLLSADQVLQRKRPGRSGWPICRALEDKPALSTPGSVRVSDAARERIIGKLLPISEGKTNV